MRLLPVYFPHDLSACCGGQELAQKAQEFILCAGNINDCRVLFLHNAGDVPSNACRVHAVLLVVLHLTDAPGDAPAIFIIAENTFLACFCKSGANVAQLYNGNNVDLVRVYRIARQLSILQPNYHRARDVMQQLMEVQHTEECDHRLDRRCGE